MNISQAVPLEISKGGLALGQLGNPENTGSMRKLNCAESMFDKIECQLPLKGQNNYTPSALLPTAMRLRHMSLLV